MNPTTNATEGSAPAPVLYLALELSNRSWRLAFGDGASEVLRTPLSAFVQLVDEQFFAD